MGAHQERTTSPTKKQPETSKKLVVLPRVRGTNAATDARARVSERRTGEPCREVADAPRRDPTEAPMDQACTSYSSPANAAGWVEIIEGRLRESACMCLPFVRPSRPCIDVCVDVCVCVCVVVRVCVCVIYGY